MVLVARMDQDDGLDDQMGQDPVDQAELDQDLVDPGVADQDPAADRVDLRIYDDLDVARASRP